jgi:hypothetical protein
VPVGVRPGRHPDRALRAARPGGASTATRPGRQPVRVRARLGPSSLRSTRVGCCRDRGCLPMRVASSVVEMPGVGCQRFGSESQARGREARSAIFRPTGASPRGLSNNRGAPEIEQFLTDLAVNGHISASTQNQAFFALPRVEAWHERLGFQTPSTGSATESPFRRGRTTRPHR